MKIWRVTNKEYCTDYIRAESADDACSKFFDKHGKKAVEYQVIDHKVFAIFFSGGGSPAYFKGTKEDALAGGRLYIRQWDLNETISSIQEI